MLYEGTANRILIIVTLVTLAVCAALITVARRRARLMWPAGPRASLRPPVDDAFGLQRAFPRVTDGPGPHAGDVLGHYQLLTCVGEGGMGRVWAARNVSSALQRLVAVKTAINVRKRTAEARHLFMDEARIALLIRHPNVCGVHELGEHEGVLFQVMEWCDGASLRQVLDQLPEGRMGFAVAARLVAKVSAGLQAAHELEDDDGTPMHVVHRDVSPQNILISASGQVKVTDFGVAKAHGQLHRSTAMEELKGKLTYMAPEQVTGQAVDRRADIFALGSILYEATTGYSPFAGEESPSALYQLLSRPVVSPRARLKAYPADLARIVLKALSKDPAQRFSTAEEFGVALEGWLAATHGVVTEQTFAELMARSVGGFIREKSRRIDQALASLASRPSLHPEPFTMPALAGASLTPSRPTVPVGRARKPGLAR